MKILTSVTENRVALLEVEGEVDAHTARKLDQALKDLLAQGFSRLMLDASRMAYISSAGLRVLMSTQREARQLGGEMRLFGLNAQVRRVFNMTGFGELLRVSDTCQEAMEGW